MKPSREERENLLRRIGEAREKAALTKAAVAALAGVDPGQASRILDGGFKTVSGSVLRICNALGVDPHSDAPDANSPVQVRKRIAWEKLQASVRRAWDETPQGADRLVAVIDAVADVAPRAGTGRGNRPHARG